MAKKATAEENVEVTPQPVAKKQPKIEKPKVPTFEFNLLKK